MRRGIWGLLFVAISTAILLAGCQENSSESGQGGFFTVNGTVQTRFGEPIANATVIIQSDLLFAGSGFTASDGSFSVGGIPAGTYNAIVQTFVDFQPVDVVSAPFTVTNSDVTIPPIIVPEPIDLQGVNAPIGQGALVVFAQNQFGQPVNATVQVEGVPGSFSGQDGRVVLQQVPIGNRDVFISFDSRTVVRRNVPFTAGTITVLNVQSNETPVGSFIVSGTVVTTQGDPVGDIQVVLRLDDTQFDQVITQPNGAFSFTTVSPGTYVLEVVRSLNGVPVITQTSPIVVSNANITGQIVTIPTAQDVSSIGFPINSALLVIPRTQANTPVQVTVQVEGVQQIFGPGTLVSAPNIPVGDRTVTITSANDILVLPNVNFTAGVITAINAHLD